MPCCRIRHLVQIHEYRNEWGLSVRGHQCDDLILDGLHSFFDLAAHPHFGHLVRFFLRILHAERIKLFAHLAARFLPGYLDERRQVGKSDALTAVLAARDLGNDLGRHVARCRETVRLFDHRLGNDRSVLKHIFQIDQAAVVHVLGKIVRIMEMDDPFFVRFHDVCRKQETLRNVF